MKKALFVFLLCCAFSIGAHAENTALFENDFERDAVRNFDNTEGVFDFTHVDDEHGQSLALHMDSDVTLWKYFKRTDATLYYIGFDARAEYDYVNSYFRLVSRKINSFTSLNSQYVIEPFFMRLDPLTSWHIGFMRDTDNWDAPNAKPNEFSYKAQQWYHVDMWLDIANHNLYSYLDGEYFGRTAIPETFDAVCGMAYITKRRDNGHFFLKTPPVGKPELQLDNFKIISLDENTADYSKICKNVPYQITDAAEISLSSLPGNINYEAKSVPFEVTVKNTKQHKENFTVLYEAFDSGNKLIWKNSEEMSLDAENEKTSSQIINANFEYGYYKFRVTLTAQSSGSVLVKQQNFSNLHTPPDGLHNIKTGFNNHQKYLHGDPAIKFEMQRRTGSALTRDGLPWEDVEKEAHVYKTDENYESWVNLAGENGIEIINALSYGNKVRTPENPPRSDEALKAFGDYVYNFVLLGKGRVQYYEVWNEYNAKFSVFNVDGGTPDDYFNLLKICYTNIKRANPDAKVIGIDSARYDADFTRRVFELGGGDYLDIVSFHPYPYNYAHGPEEGQVLESTQKMRSIMDEFGLQDKELWLTELGYSSGKNYMSEESQASYVVRSLAMLDGVCDRIIWYVSQNKILNDDLEANFGFIRAWQGLDVPYEAKPSMLAFSNWNAMMTNAEKTGTCEVNQSITAHEFTLRSGEKAVVLWSRNKTQSVALDLGCDFAVLTDMYGNSTDLSAFDGAFQLNIGTNPVYLTGSFTKCESVEPKITLELDGKLELVKNDSKSLVLNKNSDILLSVSTKLPSNISSSTGSVFDKKNYELKLLTGAEECEDSSVKIYVQNGKNICFYADCAVVYKNAAEVSLKVLPSGRQWYGVMKIKNNCSDDAVSGVFNAQSPDVLSGIKVNIPQIEAGCSETVRFPIPDSYSGESINIIGDTVLSSGDTARLEAVSDLYRIAYAEKKPTVDGNITAGEWDSDTIMLSDESRLYKITGWGGVDDLSAKIRLMWDESNLYLSYAVTDDIFGYDLPGKRLWAGDSAQFSIAKNASASEKHTEIAFGLIEGKPRVRRYTYRGDSVDVEDDELYNGNVEYAVNRSGNTVSYEMRIGWEEIMPEDFNIYGTETIAFSTIVNENDGNGRRGWMEYGSGIGVVKNPGLFKNLPLVKKD